MFKKLSKSLVGLALICSPFANAALISESASFSPSLIVDGSSSTTSLAVTDTGLITDVDVFVNFSKCDSVSSAGNCQSSNYSFLNEIVFSIMSPTGTSVSLVSSGTYSGGTNVSHVGVTFDDSSLNLLSGVPSSGVFNPVGSLSDFNGESVLGSWVLTYQDTAGADPLAVNSWGFNITTRESDVPVPATLALLGLGLAGIGFTSKRKNG